MSREGREAEPSGGNGLGHANGSNPWIGSNNVAWTSSSDFFIL
jgi:hypothetical protein